METETMGKTLVAAKIENLNDLFRAKEGRIKDEEVRRIEVSDALVDSGASTLLLPRSMIVQLGLEQFKIRSSRTISGNVTVPMYRAAHLTVQGRDCIIDVGEIPDGNPVIIGQIPLEIMDWVIDMKGQKLIGNPEHGGDWMMDIFMES